MSQTQYILELSNFPSPATATKFKVENYNIGQIQNQGISSPGWDSTMSKLSKSFSIVRFQDRHSNLFDVLARKFNLNPNSQIPLPQVSLSISKLQRRFIYDFFEVTIVGYATSKDMQNNAEQIDFQFEKFSNFFIEVHSVTSS